MPRSAPTKNALLTSPRAYRFLKKSQATLEELVEHYSGMTSATPWTHKKIGLDNVTVFTHVEAAIAHSAGDLGERPALFKTVPSPNLARAITWIISNNTNGSRNHENYVREKPTRLRLLTAHSGALVRCSGTWQNCRPRAQHQTPCAIVARSLSWHPVPTALARRRHL